MMKKCMALLLVLMLILPCAALAQEGTLNGKTATRTGPGTKYTEELGTLSPPIQLQVIAQVETNETRWYHVEFARGGKTYRVYVLESKVKASGYIPWEGNDGIPDVLIASARAYYGPGENYAVRPGTLAQGTEVTVACVEGEWALCEYREDWRWARGYIHVSSLRDTQAEAAPQETPVWYEQEPEITIEPGWTAVSGSALGDDSLPCVNAAVLCFFTAAQDIYAGPGDQYQLQTGRDELTVRGILGAGVRVYGQENGWALIRYPSGEPGEYRYGWVPPEALTSADGAQIPQLSFYYLPTAVLGNVTVTEDPDILGDGEAFLPQGTPVTALAFLNSDPAWVYCDYSWYQDGFAVTARGFLPVETLAIQ